MSGIELQKSNCIRKSIFKTPIYPILPIYRDEKLDDNLTVQYMNFLIDGGAKCLMSTAGTTQYNLLSDSEIDNINYLLQGVCTNRKIPCIIGMPPHSQSRLAKTIKSIGVQENKYIMLLYPDRYYSDDLVLNFFYKLADASELPVFVHAMFMRGGTGGFVDYSNSLYQGFKKHDNIIGVKEECMSIDQAAKTCSNIDIEIIVAGGSQKRLWNLLQYGATNFLSGVGSFSPMVDLDFFYEIHKDINKAYVIMSQVERNLFSVFMKIGWHKAMREAVSQMLFNKNLDEKIDINRQPFPQCSTAEKQLISGILEEI